MEKLLKILPSHARNKVEGWLASYRHGKDLRECEQLESSADKERDPTKAADLYSKAAEKAKTLGEDERGVNMLLRGSRRIECIASQSENLARSAPADSQWKEIHLDAFIAYIHAAKLLYQAKEPLKRTRDLVERAQSNLTLAMEESKSPRVNAHSIGNSGEHKIYLNLKEALGLNGSKAN